MAGPKCGMCGTLLGHIDEPCPICLPGFVATDGRPRRIPPPPGFSGKSLGYTQGFAEGVAHGRHIGLAMALIVAKQFGCDDRTKRELERLSKSANAEWERSVLEQITGD